MNEQKLTKKQILSIVKEALIAEGRALYRNFGYETHAQRCVRIIDELSEKDFNVIVDLLNCGAKVIVGQSLYKVSKTGMYSRWNISLIEYLVLSKNKNNEIIAFTMSVPSYANMRDYTDRCSHIDSYYDYLSDYIDYTN